MMTYALHATTFMRTTSGLPVIVVRLGTTLDVPAWQSVKSPARISSCLNCEDSAEMHSLLANCHQQTEKSIN